MRTGSAFPFTATRSSRSEEHTSELQSLTNLVCRLLLEKKKKIKDKKIDVFSITFKKKPKSVVMSTTIDLCQQSQKQETIITFHDCKPIDNCRCGIQQGN